MKSQPFLLWIVLLFSAFQVACGGGSSPASTTSTGGSSSGSGSGGTGGSGGGSGSTSQFTHVFVLVEENHSFNDVIGNTNMPYLNSLVPKYGLATQYFADTHPSLANYLMLTVGLGDSLTGTQGDGYLGPVMQDNIVRALTAAGKTWKYYGESLPSVGYLGPDSGLYGRKHNPFALISDVQNSSTQADNMVPFSPNFASDLANNTFPNYSFIVPNQADNAHDCPVNVSPCTDTQKLANLDAWLQTNIDPLIKSAAFSTSVLIITFDEGDGSDTAHGGGQVATLVISPKAKVGYQSTTFYQHESVLRLSLKGLGVPDLPGAAATAPDMTEFFQ